MNSRSTKTTARKLTIAVLLLITALSTQIVAQSQVSANSATSSHDLDDAGTPGTPGTPDVPNADGNVDGEVAAEGVNKDPNNPIETALADLLKPRPTRTRAPTRT